MGPLLSEFLSNNILSFYNYYDAYCNVSVLPAQPRKPQDKACIKGSLLRV